MQCDEGQQHEEAGGQYRQYSQYKEIKGNTGNTKSMRRLVGDHKQISSWNGMAGGWFFAGDHRAGDCRNSITSSLPTSPHGGETLKIKILKIEKIFRWWQPSCSSISSWGVISSEGIVILSTSLSLASHLLVLTVIKSPRVLSNPFTNGSTRVFEKL